ncbi:MAG: carbohydrate kinase [Bacteroidales bacterium]|nr:carbohydrate kinase [Bacteroidales bacterium]
MYLLGYDLGSSSVKASLVNAETGRTVATAFCPKQEAPIKSLQPGWAEQSPADWWTRVKAATAELTASLGPSRPEIKAIGISYQMHGLVLLDQANKLLRDAIIWCDSRGVPYGEKAFREVGQERCLASLLNSPGNFTASKLAWVMEHEQDTFARIARVLLPGEWLNWRLTGEFTTTPEGLSEQMLWDFKRNQPAQFMLDWFGFRREWWPDIHQVFGEHGHLTGEAALELGLTPGIPVTYVAGDQPNNALSLAVLDPGEVASTGGTSGVVYGIIGAPQHDPQSRVNCFAHVNHSTASPRIGVMACINGCGILNSWMRRNVAPEMSYAQMNDAASQVPAGSDGVSILPWGNGAERVLQNRDDACSVHGLSFTRHDRRHLLRAAQEGIAFAFMYGMEVMGTLGMDIHTIHAGRANLFLSPVFRQTLSDVSGATIVLHDTDGASGAARGAGIGAGLYTSPREAFNTLATLAQIHPGPDAYKVKDAYARWKNLI